MSPDKTEKLFNDFPVLYQGKDKPITENLMAFGFSCGDGWYAPLRKLSEKLEAYNTEHPDAPVIAIQVKEKYGTLRFYADRDAVKEVRQMIREAEIECNKVCEICGTTTDLGCTIGYIQHVCRVCAGPKRGWTPDTEDKTDVRGPAID